MRSHTLQSPGQPLSSQQAPAGMQIATPSRMQHCSVSSLQQAAFASPWQTLLVGGQHSRFSKRMSGIGKLLTVSGAPEGK
ncbi:MAG: hypothetical protein KF883_00145 [Thermomicrobiales bacterium]|nr:hypothetical protein [Thermomicrobiales bacterium]